MSDVRLDLKDSNDLEDLKDLKEMRWDLYDVDVGMMHVGMMEACSKHVPDILEACSRHVHCNCDGGWLS